MQWNSNDCKKKVTAIIKETVNKSDRKYQFLNTIAEY